jgi:hypothetical protein
LTIDAPDSLAFLLTINDKPVNQYPIVSVTFNSPVSGKTNLKVEFPTKPVLNFTQIVNIKKGSNAAYTIERFKGALKLVLSSETILTPEETASAAEEITPVYADTMANPVPHNGCENLVDEQLYQDMIVAVDGQHFESKKLSVMSEFALVNCIRTDHLRYMLSKLSQEDNKLVLLQSAKQHIYDRNNLPEAANDFFLARNKAKAIEIISSDR